MFFTEFFSKWCEYKLAYYTFKAEQKSNIPILTESFVKVLLLKFVSTEFFKVIFITFYGEVSYRNYRKKWYEIKLNKWLSKNVFSSHFYLIVGIAYFILVGG